MGKRYRDPFDTCHGLIFDDSMSDESGIDIPASSSSKKLRLHDFSSSVAHSFNQSLDQSINQPNCQSCDDLFDADPHMGSMDCTDLEGHPIESDSDQSVDQTVNHSNNHQWKHSHNGLSTTVSAQKNSISMKQPTNQSVSQPISQPIKRPTNQYRYLEMTEAEYDARSILSLEPTDMIRQWLERDSLTTAPMEHCYQ